MTIGILGIGGVGGYFGGLLAAYYAPSHEHQIVFIPSKRSVEVLNRDGLKLTTPNGVSVIRPHKVSTDASDIGKLDVLICTTKSYDLADALKPLAVSITSSTLILPLLNGVSARQTIQHIFPEAQVLDGCVYVNAKRTAPGVIEKTGTIERLYFGSNTISHARLAELQKVFIDAGLDSYLSDDIETDIWTKFVFMAGMGTATTYFEESIGAVLENDSHHAIIRGLVAEAHAIAMAKGIELPQNIVDQTMDKLAQLPYEGTSSMQRDFQQGGKTEYRSLSSYIVELGDELAVDTPVFDSIIPTLEARQHNKS
jgi:2-dehydropantoate 2-reductase